MFVSGRVYLGCVSPLPRLPVSNLDHDFFLVGDSALKLHLPLLLGGSHTQNIPLKNHPLYGNQWNQQWLNSHHENHENQRAQHLASMTGRRIHPDKSVSYLDQNPASWTNLRICIYAKPVKLAKFVPDSSVSTRSEFNGILFQQMRGFPQIWDRGLTRFTENEKVDLLRM